MPAALDRVAVLGLGHIGGSLLQALHAAGHDCLGYDPDRVTAGAAADDGFEIAVTIESAVAAADLVILAMPLPHVAPTLAALRGHLPAAAILTDVGTLKRPVLDAVRAELPGARFVGGHPLAGREDSGWTAADPTLFRDAPWALTIEDGLDGHSTDLDAWLALAGVLCELGAHPVPATADEQDAAVARVIGLPHVLAETLALTGLDGGPLGLSLAAGSYRSGSRVARTRPELVATWCDGNAALVTALDDVLARLTSTRDALAHGGSVLALARDGHDARMNWEHRPAHALDVMISIPALLAHGRAGGWITAVHETAQGVRLRGMRPA